MEPTRPEGLTNHGRDGYSGIRGRPVHDWPKGERLAVHVGLDLAHFAFGEGFDAMLCPAGPQPDVRDFSWPDYGNRVGAWRLLDLFEDLRLFISVLVGSCISGAASK